MWIWQSRLLLTSQLATMSIRCVTPFVRCQVFVNEFSSLGVIFYRLSASISLLALIIICRQVTTVLPQYNLPIYKDSFGWYYRNVEDVAINILHKPRYVYSGPIAKLLIVANTASPL
ncbi:hypothetical protein FJZ31_41015 [Candidatus Poribacteria bacterium]|nr:hypothetical protein [Candidatus Poribacteria bacterium]